MDRRTRIVATLGPATDRPGVLEQLCRSGLDVARINCSHGTAEDHVRRVTELRAMAVATNRNIAVLADLPGPKLRVIVGQPQTLLAGELVSFAAEPKPDQIGVTEPTCLAGVQPGHHILLDDARLQLRAESNVAGTVTAVVLIGGVLSPMKGLNLPQSSLGIPAITPRDHIALKVAAQVGADWLALSFVRTAEAADELRAAAKAVGLDVPVLAKIERPEGVERIARIVAAFDGIMVARGDLGVEMLLEQVPVVQKRLIAEARVQGKPVVTATDMLDSMRTNPRPTRAEASDVANAIYDGTDAVMLSGETAVGVYPVEALQCMDRIARQAEADQIGRECSTMSFYPSLDDDLAATVCGLAQSTSADVIITPTLSGRTARQVARHRPRATVIAPVPREEVRRRLALVWGVKPVPLSAQLPAGADRIDAAVRAAFESGCVKPGQLAVVVAGHPVEQGPRLPTMRLVRVGENGASITP